VNAFVRKIGFWISQIEERDLDMFPKLDAFRQDNNMEISETGIERCIREHLIREVGGNSATVGNAATLVFFEMV
jgi:hypothetical protein